MTEKIDILYKGAGYVIVNKPQGAESEDKGAGSVPSLVKDTLGISHAAPCHRLDMAVGGAMLLCTDKNASKKLSCEINEGKLKKEYICICEGFFPDEEKSSDMVDLLYFDRQKRKSYVVRRARGGVKEASLSYKVIGECEHNGKQMSLVHVELKTGRTHQIRVQFASRRHALVGDGKYGSKDNGAHVSLHCLALTLFGVRTEAPIPDTYPWNLFNIINII